MSTPPDRALLLSIRPRFAQLVLDERKTVELRRKAPRVHVGALVLLYASSPEKALVGTARVAAINTGTPNAIWKSSSGRTSLTRSEFDEYFDGTDEAVAISLEDVSRLEPARPLHAVRDENDWFEPPQSFCYLEPSQVVSLRLALP